MGWDYVFGIAPTRHNKISGSEYADEFESGINGGLEIPIRGKTECSRGGRCYVRHGSGSPSLACLSGGVPIEFNADWLGE